MAVRLGPWRFGLSPTTWDHRSGGPGSQPPAPRAAVLGSRSRPCVPARGCPTLGPRRDRNGSGPGRGATGTGGTLGMPTTGQGRRGDGGNAAGLETELLFVKDLVREAAGVALSR